MKTKLCLLSILALALAPVAFCGPRAASPYIPEAPAPKFQPRALLPEGAHVLTIGQYLHLQHSRHLLAAGVAQAVGDKQLEKRHRLQVTMYLSLMVSLRDVLDEPYTGPLGPDPLHSES